MTESGNALSGNQWTITKRPQKFDDLYGQDEVVHYFKNIQQTKAPIPNAIWLGGKFGCGKTTIAKIIAKTIQCKNKDADGNPCGKCISCQSIENETWGRNTIMFNGGTNGTIDEVRKLVGNVDFPPTMDGNWVFMIEEAQELSADATQALLKTVETPRNNVYFIFTSMEEDLKKLGKFDALISRCGAEFKLNTATVMDVMFYLRHILETENLWDTIPKEFKLEGLKLIATNCKQSYREALKKLQICVNSGLYSVDQISAQFGITKEGDISTALNDLISGRWTDAVDVAFIGIPKPKDEKIKKRYPIGGVWVDEDLLNSNPDYQKSLKEMGLTSDDLKETVIKGSSKVLKIREANFKEAFRQLSNIILKKYTAYGKPIPRNIKIVYEGLKGIIEYCSTSYYDYAYCGSEIGLILDKCNQPEAKSSDVVTSSAVIATPANSVGPVPLPMTETAQRTSAPLTRMTTDTVVPGENAPQATRVVATPERAPERAPGRTIVRGVTQSTTVQNATARIINRG